MFDAARLYTAGCIRAGVREPYRMDKAREIHQQIVEQHPDLLINFVVWSRDSLACLYPTADERFRGRLEFYRWFKSVGPAQYETTMEWMKREYRFRNAGQSELRDRIDGLLKGTLDSLQTNIVDDAKASSNPPQNLTLLDEVMKAGSDREVRPPEQLSAVGLGQAGTISEPNVSARPNSGRSRSSVLGVLSVICLSLAGAAAASIVTWKVLSTTRRASRA
jgi:hypothetical protein